MKRIIVLILLPLVLGIALGLSLKASDDKGSASVRRAVKRPMPPDLACFTQVSKRLPDEFNVLVPIGERVTGLSVAFNVQNHRNFYLVELAGTVKIVKVESGILLALTEGGIPAGLPSDYDLVIKRRRCHLAVVVNGTLCAEASDDSFRGGSAMVSTSGGFAAESVKVQRVGEIFFADDFMKGAEAGSQWEEVSGTWHVNTLKNSGLSSNAFFYTGRAGDGPALSAGGYWFWGNYAFEASCKPEGSKHIGLCFYYRGPKDYFLFRWNLDNADGCKQLIKVSNGRMSVLAQQPGGYTVNQWYTMEVRANGRTAKTFIDGNPIFSVYDDGLAYGKVGLYNEGSSAARFDDVFVRSHKSTSDTFSSRSAAAWQQLGGTWAVCPVDPSAPDGEYILRAEAPDGAKAVTGKDGWRNYTFAAAVGGWKQGEVGLAARYRDEAHHYLYAVGADGTQRLVKFSRGVRTVLAQKHQPLATDRPHKLFFSVEDNILIAGIDGNQSFEEWDDAIKSGRAGLYASNVGTVDFDNVSATMRSQGGPVLTTNEVFSHEKTMANWASELSDWHATKEALNEKTYAVSWHRADFPGDVELTVKLGFGLPAGSAIHLGICAGENRLDSGYGMSVCSEDGLAVELFRLGQSIAKQTVHADEPIRVSLKRKGSFVIGLVNFEPVVKLRDPAPLKGVTVGIGHTGVEVPKENIEVFCPNVCVYTFDKASSDWRVATGTWQVSNRWQCDPRWSFFSGVSKGDAILWCKRMLKGDVTLEFAAAIKMDRARGGNYEYASDINATICADGKDLTSGYSFTFGGWQNSCSRIMRGTEVLSETKTNVIPIKSNIHRRWFFLKIRKRGSKLQYFIDNSLALEVDDPQPLTGNMLAIWTHNNGIMVAKVRMSCLDGEQRESPDFKTLEIPESPYTAEAKAKAEAKKQ